MIYEAQDTTAGFIQTTKRCHSLPAHYPDHFTQDKWIYANQTTIRIYVWKRITWISYSRNIVTAGIIFFFHLDHTSSVATQIGLITKLLDLVISWYDSLNPLTTEICLFVFPLWSCCKCSNSNWFDHKITRPSCFMVWCSQTKPELDWVPDS